ncbi:MAG: immunoglobulin domain-containing protein [Phycisphaerales bacterium]|nr:immunoglobulin domain-containing protein [Phycisphaerales bacterium]
MLLNHRRCRKRARGATLATAGWIAWSGAAAAQGVQLPADANVVVVTQPPYNAVGDGTTDNTAAFQAALNDVVGTGRVLYVPDGQYAFSGRLNWGGVRSGGFFVMQGQSQARTVLRLNDGAAGFGDPNAPLVFIDAYEGNTANQFRNYLRDLTIDIGANNPGAVGLQFQASNTGRIENVTIRSSDLQKRGAIGLDQGFSFPGPMLLRNITIDGFDSAYIGAPQEYSVTMENITLRDQRVRGIGVYRLPLQIRNLVSFNRVRVFESFENPGAWGQLVVDGATINGIAGAETADAFFNVNSGGVMLLRNVNVTGYRYAVNDQSFSVTSPTLVPVGFVPQYATDPAASLNPSPAAVLSIPVEDAPPLPSVPVGQWVSVKSFGAIENDNLDDTAAIRAALRSGAAVVYFPSGLYVVSDTLDIGPAVSRIEGLLSEFYLNAPLVTEDRPLFRISPGGQPVVHIGGVQTSLSGPAATRAGGVWLEHGAASTVVVRDGDLTGYRNTVAGGKVFLENVVGEGLVFTGQRVWARQLNPEGSRLTHITNIGGDLYILGLKTEGTATVLDNRAGARAAVLGGLVYPSSPIADRTTPMVINNESSLSWAMAESCYVADGYYDVWVRETRGGVTGSFTRSMLPFGRSRNCGGLLNLYNGYQADPSPPSAPGAPSLVSRDLTSFTFTWAPSSDAQSGVARYNVYRGGSFYRSAMTNSLTESGLGDNTGFSYRVAAVNGAGLESAPSGVGAFSTLRDGEAPRVRSVSAGLDPRLVTVTFTEPVAAAGAQTPTNYTLSGPAPATVVGASLASDGRAVTLTATPMAAGVHTLVISNIRDLATSPNTILAGTRTAFEYADAGGGTGLTGRYYTNRDFTGSPVLTRVDPTINFDWSASGPGGGLPQANYGVRWTGQLRPRFTETYTLSVRSDDGTRLFVDGVLAVSNWADQGATERSATVALDSSRTHDIVIEYYQATGGASVELFWQSASQPRQIVPQAFLLPTPRLNVVRTFDGAGADTTLVRFGSADEGAGNSTAAFHGPSGFHRAAYWRFDLSPLGLANNYVADAVATLSQTFFGIGDGRRQINVFTVNQAANGDNWAETGPGFVRWDTAAGNDDTGALCNTDTARWAATYLLDNSQFRLNNQPDLASFGGPRLLELLNADTDGRVTFLAKRMDASNEGQSWFTKEWGIPGFAPALKVRTLPNCALVARAPSAPPSVVQGQPVTLTAAATGKPPLAYQWRRNGAPLAESSRLIGTQSESLTIAAAGPPDSGVYDVVVTSAAGGCAPATSPGATLAVAPTSCPADVDNNGAVGANDLSIVLSAFGTSYGQPGFVPRADIDGNGAVGANDLSVLLSAFGLPCG